MSFFDDIANGWTTDSASADERLAELYPGDRGVRQPVHTVYVPADTFTADLAQDWGRQAGAALGRARRDRRRSWPRPSAPTRQIVAAVYDRVVDKLDREPIEDLRIDFEDGYGPRPDDEEDAAAIAAARELRQGRRRRHRAAVLRASASRTSSGPPGGAGLRTLDLFIGELAGTGGLPDGFVSPCRR